MQFPVFASNQRFGQTVFVMNKIVGKSAFDAQISIVERLARWRAGDFDDSIVVRVQIELTADATKIAGCPRRSESPTLPGLSGLSFRSTPRSGKCQCNPTQFAGRIDQRVVGDGRNRCLRSAIGQRDRIDRFDLIAVTRATGAQDAEIGIEFNVGIEIPVSPARGASTGSS